MESQQAFSFARSALARFFLAFIVAIAVLAPLAANSKESAVPRKFAGIVIDAKSGKVLYESAADGARYPASVTKVMTLYILFQELSAGNIQLSDKMVVSAHAAAAVPTKLGLKAGSKVSVENAIKSIVTLSANDMARVIAEHISGSESAFAQRMTTTAKALGMSRTTYRNASGLPDRGQVTTVRDQAILGIAIYQHFPKYYAYFQTKSFSYGKRTYGNHNRLLGSNNVDGIKTGYTAASGFNLMTAARDPNRHIVVVGFGFDSSGARDAKVRELVKKYFGKGRKGDYLETAMIPRPGRKGASVQLASAPGRLVMPMPYPAFRLGSEPAEVAVALPAPIEDPVMVASVGGPVPAQRPNNKVLQPAVDAANLLGSSSSNVVDPQDRPLDVIGAWLSDTFELGAAPAPLGQTAPSAPLLPPVGIGEGGKPIDLMTSGGTGIQPEPVLAQLEPPPLSAGWIVQIGAAPTETGANTLLSDAAGSVSHLGSFQPYVERVEKNGQIFYRARFAGFDGREDAAAMCSQLKQAKKSCLAMQS